MSILDLIKNTCTGACLCVYEEKKLEKNDPKVS